MFRFIPVWLKLRGFHIRNFYHLTPCWSRSLSCIHSIVIICWTTLNQNALYKALFQLGCHLHIPNQEIRFYHWNHDRIAQLWKENNEKKMSWNPQLSTTQVRLKQKENTTQEKNCCWYTEVFPKSSQVQHQHPTFDSYHRLNIIF